MSWRSRGPKRSDYDTQEEYEEAMDSFYDAIADDADAAYESRKLRDE